jgi:cytochrome P450
MREELRREFTDTDYRNWNYETHPNLKRTLAVQLETIRLYNPLIGISKGTLKGRTCQVSFDRGKSMVTLPSQTMITVEINALHTLPDYWGEDALEWKPSRWIRTDEAGNETLWTPEKGVFYGWSDGLRACPGKKFGHLEHLAVMAAVFRNHAVHARPEKGESVQQTRHRIEEVIKDSGPVLNNQMLHPEKASLVWRRC